MAFCIIYINKLEKNQFQLRRSALKIIGALFSFHNVCVCMYKKKKKFIWMKGGGS